MHISVGLISDSHGYMDEAILRHLQEVDEVWHAGDIGDLDVLEQLPRDKTLRIITGNIDGSELRNHFPEEQVFSVDGVEVYMTHIGGNPNRYAKGIADALRKYKPHVFVCGHSHICRVQYDPKFGCLYLNPGAVGMQGFHRMRTMLKFSIKNGKIGDLAVVELGKRGIPSH